MLKKFLDIFILIYLDDILIYSRTEKEHKDHVRQVLEALLKENLRINPDKTEFHRKEVEFLGYIIKRKEIKINQKKIQAVLD